MILIASDAFQQTCQQDLRANERARLSTPVLAIGRRPIPRLAETHPSSCLNVALFARTSSTIKSMAARTRAMPWRSACVTIQ